MNYIINPSWFYWLGVVNSMRSFMVAAFIVAIIIVGVSLIVSPGLVGGDYETDFLQYECIGCPYIDPKVYCTHPVSSK